MELWTNKLLLSFKFDNSVKFDKPSYEIQQTDRRSRALPNTACALPTRSRAKPTAKTDLMLNATLRTLQVTVRRSSNSDQHTITKMDERSTGKHFFHWVPVP